MPLDFAWPFNDPQNKILGQLRWKVSSKFVLTGVGLVSKILGGYLSRVTVHNKERFVDFVERRPAGQSLITVSNHYSCMDDPLLWGAIFSTKTLAVKTHLNRWIPSAHDICFTRQIYVWFFARGRCVPCVRGEGVYQQGVDFCIEQLNKGEWVHIFAEGGVNMTKELKRLKWGVGRLISEAKQVPIVLPFFHFGYDDILPNYPPYIPRLGKKATVLVGEPMDFTAQLNDLRAARKTPMETRKSLTDRIQEELATLRAATEKLHFGSDVGSSIPPNKDDQTGS